MIKPPYVLSQRPVRGLVILQAGEAETGIIINRRVTEDTGRQVGIGIGHTVDLTNSYIYVKWLPMLLHKKYEWYPQSYTAAQFVTTAAIKRDMFYHAATYLSTKILAQKATPRYETEACAVLTRVQQTRWYPSCHRRGPTTLPIHPARQGTEGHAYARQLPYGPCTRSEEAYSSAYQTRWPRSAPWRTSAQPYHRCFPNG